MKIPIKIGIFQVKAQVISLLFSIADMTRNFHDRRCDFSRSVSGPANDARHEKETFLFSKCLFCQLFSARCMSILNMDT